MKQYTIEIKKLAKKFIERQPKKQQERILKAVYKLPYEGDIDTLSGHDDVFRLRVGGYRVIYTIKENILTIEVLDAGNHGDVYMKKEDSTT